MSLFESGKKSILLNFDSDFYSILKKFVRKQGLTINGYVRNLVINAVLEKHRDDLDDIPEEEDFNNNPERQKIRLTKGVIKNLSKTHRDLILKLINEINENEDKEEEEAKRVEEEIEREEEEEERKKFWEEYHKEEWEDEK